MTSLSTAMAACRVITAAYQLADAVVLLRDFALFSGIASKTGTLATVAAGADMATLGSAAIFGGSDIFVTSNLDLVIAAWNGACYMYHAAYRGRILCLPALG